MVEPRTLPSVPAAAIALLAVVIMLCTDNAYAFSDPTAPTNLQGFPGGSGKKGWDLSSTLITDDRRVAVINGKPLREGQRLGEARVIRISKSKVVLRTERRDITLHLFDARDGKRVRRP